MDAADFFGQPIQLPDPSPVTAAAGEEAPEPVEPVVVFMDQTPSGIMVEYSAKPRRYYRVNGIEVPSVTTVLNALHKDLSTWGMKIGIAGAIRLFEMGQLQAVIDQVEDGKFKTILRAGALEASVDSVLPLLKEFGLNNKSVLEDASDRGQAVHDSFELWCKTGALPNPDDFGEREAGYVESLANFIVDLDATPEGTEVMVGSAEHGYAGRFDVRLRVDTPATVCVHYTPKGRGDRYEEIPVGSYLSDVKTSKDVYPFSHFRQLEAYEHAAIEGGYTPTDGRYVIQLSPHGKYKYVRSQATFEDFLDALRIHQSNERILERIKAAKPQKDAA
jgi:hypothetical protein